MSNGSNVSMNEALREWINESKEEIRLTQKRRKKSKKKPSGKCSICGKNDAVAFCLKCNKPVCSSCYFKIIGICKNCITEDVARKWAGSRPDWEKELGIEWVD